MLLQAIIMSVYYNLEEWQIVLSYWINLGMHNMGIYQLILQIKFIIRFLLCVFKKKLS